MGSATARKGGVAAGPRSASDSISKLAGIGIHVKDPTFLSGLGDQYVQDVADQLEHLENKYGAIRDNGPGGIPMTARSGGMGSAYAYVSRYKGNTRIVDFRVSTSRDYDTINAKVAEHNASNWFMKTNMSGAKQIITHEYGHILQFTMAGRAGKTNERQIGAFATSQKKAIMKIAQTKYGATSNDVSRYGLTNSKEFFAEAFANANGGSPNAIGKAFNDYMAQYLS